MGPHIRGKTPRYEAYLRMLSLGGSSLQRHYRSFLAQFTCSARSERISRVMLWCIFVIFTLNCDCFLYISMGPKKASDKGSSEKKKRMMSMEIKHEIIEKHERGVRVSDLARQYDRSTSTICTILKQKDAIKAVNPSKGITIISKLRCSPSSSSYRLRSPQSSVSKVMCHNKTPFLLNFIIYYVSFLFTNALCLFSSFIYMFIYII